MPTRSCSIPSSGCHRARWARFLTLLIAAIVASGSLVTTVEAQPHVEVTGVGGYRTGSVQEFSTGIVCIAITASCPSVARGDDGGIVGIGVNVALTPNVAVETLVTRQRSSLTFTSAPEPSSLFDEDFSHTLVQGGLAYRWDARPVTPFVAAGLGVSRLSLGETLFDIAETSLSAYAAGGALWWINRRVALRIEARHSWIDLSDEVGGGFRTVDLTVGLTGVW